MRNLYLEYLWAVGGDFNMITSLVEKKGNEKNGYGHGNLWIYHFRIALSGPPNNQWSTWNNRRGGIHKSASLLDRFLISEQVISRDIFMEASTLPGIGSNHWMIRLEVDLKMIPKNQPFWFEAFWLRYPSLLKRIEEWWKKTEQQGRNCMHTFKLKHKDLKKKLKKCNKEEFGHIMNEKNQTNK